MGYNIVGYNRNGMFILQVVRNLHNFILHRLCEINSLYQIKCAFYRSVPYFITFFFVSLTFEFISSSETLLSATKKLLSHI